MTYAWCGCLALSGFNEYGFTSKAAYFFQNEGLEFFVIKNAVVDGEVVVRVLEMDSDSPNVLGLALVPCIALLPRFHDSSLAGASAERREFLYCVR